VQVIFEQVVALKTIQKTPNHKKGLKLLSENIELYNLIRDASNGLKARTDLLYAKDYKEKDGTRRFTDAKRYRENLISVQDNPTPDFVADWNKHMDYEAIIMDKMLDLENLPVEALMQPSARSFYTQQRIFHLMHQGYQLTKHEPYHEQAQWFEQFNDAWFFKSCATKHRLVDILQQYTPEWEASFAKENRVEESSLDSTYKLMKEIHRRRMIDAERAQSALDRFINENPHLSEYMRFVSASIEYNEELRLMRSKSVVSLIHGARHEGIEPYQVFLDVLRDRKERLQKQYGNPNEYKK